MTSRITLWLVVLAAMLSATVVAEAHPHVFVTAKGELIFGPNGALQAIHYAWTFDEMFSAFSAQGLDKNNDGKLSREETAELAKSTVESLKELNYFTKARAGAKPIEFNEPADYFFDVDDKNNLILNFTLPVKTIGLKTGFLIEVYDPEYFVAISFADSNPIVLTNAPRGCLVKLKAPKEDDGSISESFFSQLQAGADFGSQFATRINVRCP